MRALPGGGVVQRQPAVRVGREAERRPRPDLGKTALADEGAQRAAQEAVGARQRRAARFRAVVGVDAPRCRHRAGLRTAATFGDHGRRLRRADVDAESRTAATAIRVAPISAAPAMIGPRGWPGRDDGRRTWRCSDRSGGVASGAAIRGGGRASTLGVGGWRHAGRVRASAPAPVEQRRDGTARVGQARAASARRGARRHGRACGHRCR